MQNRTISAVLGARRDTVFDYLSRIENLPTWATEFCKELKVVGGCHKVITCDPDAPEMFFEIHADRATGTIDMLAGPTPDQLWLFPTRVVALPGEQSLYLFAMIQAPGLPEAKFEQQYQSLLREFDNLRRRFPLHEVVSV